MESHLQIGKGGKGGKGDKGESNDTTIASMYDDGESS